MTATFRDGDVATFRAVSRSPGLTLTRVAGVWPCSSCGAVAHSDSEVLNDVQNGWTIVRRDGRTVRVGGEPPRPEPHVFVRRQENGRWSMVCAQPITCAERGLIYTAIVGAPSHDVAIRLADAHIRASTRLAEKSIW